MLDDDPHHRAPARERPSVSIVMPCYNEAGRLRQAIESVADQSFNDYELIVVDDGSTDDSPRLLEALAKQFSFLHVVSQTNQGQAAARNHGLQAAKGRYIAFLDADDEWHPDFLRLMVEALEQTPDAALAYCGWQNVGLPGPRGEPFVPPDYENAQKLETFLRSCRWPIHAALTRVERIREVGGFDASLSSGEDFYLWLQIAPFHRLVRVPQVLAFYHHGHEGVQITRNLLRIALNHAHIQRKFLNQHPMLAHQLGRARRRELIYGELKRYAFQAFWDRDLTTAQPLFRRLLGVGYFSIPELKYLLPALLPAPLFQRMVLERDEAGAS